VSLFQNLSSRLSDTFKRLRGQAHFSQDNIQDSVREVRKALIEADVALEVVNIFISRLTDKSLGQEVATGLSPAQAFIQLVHQELVHLLGGSPAPINLNSRPPRVILMAGLQGSGKTTSSAKLAKWLKEEHKLSVLMASTDIYRPAAIQQLHKLGADIGIDTFAVLDNEQPLAIAVRALEQAKTGAYEVLIVDTAGRLHLDEALMSELKGLHRQLNPVESLLVVDSMIGQDAALTAKAFSAAISLTGIILTKTDGDARGGAALSMSTLTGQPIKFIGTGEKTAALELFDPERVASRILDMGDMLSLIKEVERNIDKNKAQALAKKLQKGQGFDLEDLREQLKQMMNLGGIAGLMDKLPGMNSMSSAMKSQVAEKANDKSFGRMIAIINSMTAKERRFPDLIQGSRKRRIALGSGTQIADVNQVLKQHQSMQKMMKKMGGKGGMMNMMRGMGGRLPTNLMGMMPGASGKLIK